MVAQQKGLIEHSRTCLENLNIRLCLFPAPQPSPVSAWAIFTKECVSAFMFKGVQILSLS